MLTARVECDQVSRGAIRTAVAGFMPGRIAIAEDAPALELPVVLDMPGEVAAFLSTTELETAERAALDHGVTVRRGQGYLLRIQAPAPVIAKALDHHDKTAPRLAIAARRTWSRYAPGDHTRRVVAPLPPACLVTRES
ncbi:hypothetical protein ACQEVM_36710 [Streptomyces sp. CA-243310]|uniref:hypothetical protein n=1 Tax=Streptomyces sp. CA-243310 TaxID=3240056 RepID=UPI003D939D47